MIERILLTPGIVDRLAELMNDSHEYVGQFLAEIRKDGIVPIQCVYCRGSKLDASHFEDEAAKQKFLQELNRNAEIAKQNIHRYAIIDFHTHSRRFGDRIREYDPYWTITKRSGYQPCSIINGRFYVSMRDGDLGDDITLEEIAQRCQKEGIKYYHLFVHPVYGSEGTPMTKDKIVITAFKYNPHKIGKVEEIPVMVLI